MNPVPLDDDLPIVPFCPWRCPTCNDGKPFTYGRRGRIRYHKCKGCGRRYRSMMLHAGELGTWGEAGHELRDLTDLRAKVLAFVRLEVGTPESDRALTAVREAVYTRRPGKQG